MKKLTFLFAILLTANMLFGQIIHIPADYATIQQGINAANPGDTVLVSPGNYVENINYNGKNITLASLFLTTGNTAYISQTVIDGNDAGSVVNFYSAEDSTAVLTGFTIRNGFSTVGGGINIQGSGPTLDHLSISENIALPFWGGGSGGGIYCNNTNSILQNIHITGNQATFGGGLYCSMSTLVLENVTISDNSASTRGGGIYFEVGSHAVFDSINRCNIYMNNAPVGNDLYSYYNNNVEVVVDTFSVLVPTELFASPLASFSFDILHGMIEQAEADLYVSPNGDNANSGLTADVPLKTIQYAMLKILADSLHPHTIHLLEGTYSPSTNGETFPVHVWNYISLSGVSESGVVLDAEGLSRVMDINENIGSEISNLTITGGYNPDVGGGIYCSNSSPTIQHVTLKNNQAGSGGGIYCNYDSNPTFQNLTITNNSAGSGGGIYYSYYSGSVLENVTVSYNSAEYSGGGIYFDWDTNPVFDSVNRCNIYLNNAQVGNDLYSNYSYNVIVLDTFSVLVPTEIFASPLDNFSFDILHGMIEQVEADLYVWPDGDNANSGLTPDAPLKTIQYAMLKILADSLHPHTVHLLEGTYSPSTNGELFPIYLVNYVSLSGTSESGVILDAEGLSSVMGIYNNMGSEISNLTITGGNTPGSGGGIYCSNSSPTIQQVTLKNNQAGSGGGIYCNYDSNPTFQNLTITNNSAVSGGGIYYSYYSGSVLENVTISFNSAEYGGGGIYFDEDSSPVFDSVNRCNIYLNNAQVGNDLYSNYSYNVIVLDTFSVLYPTEIFASPLADFSFDIQHGMIEQVEADLYVSPDGDNDNSGLTAAAPLKTIQYAMMKILADSLHPRTVHLLEGTYSPSTTGETFPVYLVSYVSLSGTSESGVILDAEGLSSVMGINNNMGSEISNLTITGGNTPGSGGGIYCSNSSPWIHDVTISNNHASQGGGINCDYYTNPTFQNLTITNNSAVSGGGIYYSYYSGSGLENVTISYNSAEYIGGGIYFEYGSNPVFDSVNRCNIYLNQAPTGADLYSYSMMNVIVDTFTVLYPRSQFASPLTNFSFNILHGLIPQENIDLYASPDGADTNTGFTENDPLKTIHHALSIVTDDSINLYTIHLLDGTYSPSLTGEVFPVSLPEYVHLDGASQESVVLDGEGFSRVIEIMSSAFVEISNLTITGGSALDYGGGIYCNNSNPLVQYVTIQNNHAIEGGGGLYLYYNSSPSLEHVTLSNNSANYGGGMYCYNNDNTSFKDLAFTHNTAEFAGGGIYFSRSDPMLENVNISNNNADNGGGIYLYYSNPVLKEVTFSRNTASNKGGGIYFDWDSNPVFDSTNRCNIYLNGAATGKDLFSNSAIEIVVDTFTVLWPKSYHAYPLNNFSFDILHGFIPQEDVELYASPNGDDANSGLTQDDPLKTIQHAITISNSDSVNLFTIHLLNGRYAPSVNGEVFPITFTDYGNLKGESEAGVILDAEGQSSVLELKNSHVGEISNLTITGGHTLTSGGGIYIGSMMATLKDLTVINNAAYYGGGIYCNNSDPLMENITIADNSANDGGGLHFTANANPLLNNVSVINNHATNNGGGVYCEHSRPDLQNVIVSGNTAFYGGGFFGFNYHLTLTNALISNNSALYGGGMFCYGADDFVINSTLADNTSDDGAGIFCFNSQITMTNSIFWNSSFDEIYLYNDAYGSSSLTTSYSNIKEGENGITINGSGTVNWLEGNINEDPLFEGSGNHPYQIDHTSPCVDAGTPDATGLNLPPWDILGNQRIWDGNGDGVATVDMGAYEYGSVPVGVEEPVAMVLDEGFSVHAYPNPFNSSATFEYNLNENGAVSFSIYDYLGREVIELVNEQQSKGTHQVKWNAIDFPSGIYYYRIRTGNNANSGKMVLVK